MLFQSLYNKKMHIKNFSVLNKDFFRILTKKKIVENLCVLSTSKFFKIMCCLICCVKCSNVEMPKSDKFVLPKMIYDAYRSMLTQKIDLDEERNAVLSLSFKNESPQNIDCTKNESDLLIKNVKNLFMCTSKFSLTIIYRSILEDPFFDVNNEETQYEYFYNELKKNLSNFDQKKILTNSHIQIYQQQFDIKELGNIMKILLNFNVIEKYGPFIENQQKYLIPEIIRSNTKEMRCVGFFTLNPFKEVEIQELLETICIKKTLGNTFQSQIHLYFLGKLNKMWETFEFQAILSKSIFKLHFEGKLYYSYLSNKRDSKENPQFHNVNIKISEKIEPIITDIHCYLLPERLFKKILDFDGKKIVLLSANNFKVSISANLIDNERIKIFLWRENNYKITTKIASLEEIVKICPAKHRKKVDSTHLSKILVRETPITTSDIYLRIKEGVFHSQNKNIRISFVDGIKIQLLNDYRKKYNHDCTKWILFLIDMLNFAIYPYKKEFNAKSTAMTKNFITYHNNHHEVKSTKILFSHTNYVLSYENILKKIFFYFHTSAKIFNVNVYKVLCQINTMRTYTNLLTGELYGMCDKTLEYLFDENSEIISIEKICNLKYNHHQQLNSSQEIHQHTHFKKIFSHFYLNINGLLDNKIKENSAENIVFEFKTLNDIRYLIQIKFKSFKGLEISFNQIETCLFKEVMRCICEYAGKTSFTYEIAISNTIYLKLLLRKLIINILNIYHETPDITLENIRNYIGEYFTLKEINQMISNYVNHKMYEKNRYNLRRKHEFCKFLSKETNFSAKNGRPSNSLEIQRNNIFELIKKSLTMGIYGMFYKSIIEVKICLIKSSDNIEYTEIVQKSQEFLNIIRSDDRMHY
ncbi:hypothetical protein EDEG_01286 [Edhazardia aedis USNM 41457]|uniref:Uncharacterized protein n=1 Tax=Edhazardia aedis (strain USNM 41457) TaxID=1003232 RepID=J8ZXT6_EDHAE|nr:hypothetical protein EDEG_01286 [Edhazardia aedis USNM 41457]|eukprot:EJW04493.1 hypothetical protein EDEG_01286 [Edhazardia aedis USNM 41457]